MRPRYLEIEGLQSFKEVQKIDFDMLSETGLFGIFGPTGSGKSTILDAITLALYANVERANRGTQGIINSSFEFARVVFIFDLLKNNVKTTYKVERLYKRKKNSENSAEARIARLLEISENGESVLADKTSEVTANIIKLIGLEADDFSRSVVLPQNKFQEFLFLERANKRRMMERIFYLEEYGRDLNEKVSKKLNFVKSRLSYIQGGISALGNITEKSLTNSETQMKETLKNKEKKDNQLRSTEAKYNENKEIWDIVKQLNIIIEEEKKHLLSLDKINDKRNIYENALKAEGLVDIIDKYIIISKNVEETHKQLQEIYNSLPKLEEDFKNAQTQHNIKVEVSEKNLPILREKISKLKNALLLQEEIEKWEETLKELRKSFSEFSRKAREDEKEIDKNKQQLEQKEKDINTYKQNIERLKINIDYRKEVQSGIILEQQLQEMKKEIKVQQDKFKELSEKTKELKSKFKSAHQLRISHEDKLERLKLKRTQLEIKKPDEMEQLMYEERKYIEISSTYQELLYKRLEIDKNNKNLEILSAEMSDLEKQYSEYESDKLETKELIDKFKKLIEDINTRYEKNTAYLIAKNLKKDTPCPVCGSLEHPQLANMVSNDSIEQLEKEIEQSKIKLQQSENHFQKVDKQSIELYSQISVSKHHLKQLRENQKTAQEEEGSLIEKLPQNMRQLDIIEIQKGIMDIENTNKENLKAISQWEKDMQNINNEIQNTEQLLSKHKISESTANTEFELTKDNLEQLQTLINNLTGELKEKTKIYKEFINKIEIQNVSNELERIEKNDREIEKTEKDIENIQESIKSIRLTLEQLIEQRQSWLDKAAKVKVEGENLDEQNKQNEFKIKQLAGDKDIEDQIKNIEKQIKKIQTEEKQWFEQLNQIKDKLDKLTTQRTSLENQKKIYSETFNAENKILNQGLDKSGFNNIEEVQKYVLNKGQRNILNNEIKEYEDKEKELITHKSLLSKKLDGRQLSGEQWEKIKEDYEEKKRVREESIEQYVSAKNIYDDIKKNFNKWVILKEQDDKHSHEKEMLEQIQKVLKGNSFIEYISEERLRYIAKEASETLSTLTNYRYLLEVDAENDFIIRDNANGGIHRPVSSLSGGETFLTSLSLALALSSQIQLKGQSPLEFFFLDEGFGTLDSNLLDTVVDALEKLSSKKRIIGLISHVPELKHRISRRLIIEAPSPLGEGSKIIIEKK